jgi:argininosuccinate synthase
VLHLLEKGYEVITATVDTGGFSDEELAAIEKKALALGSSKHYNIKAEDKIFSQIIQYLIKLNGLYEGDYPVMCADRYAIVETILEIAEKEGTQLVAHGSTAIGNDQVRFDVAFMTLNPDIEVLTPIKDLSLTRDEEIQYLESKGIEVDKSVKKYSINENVFGVTVSGSEIDEDKEPSPEAYVLTKKDPGLDASSVKYISLEFENGLPVKLKHHRDQRPFAFRGSGIVRLGRGPQQAGAVCADKTAAGFQSVCFNCLVRSGLSGSLL